VDGEAELITKILGNEVKGSQRDWALMNAAMILYTGGKAASIRAALPLAQEALSSGAAKKKLKELISQ
jgi:anthranilate phosphoribosyltransferase